MIPKDEYLERQQLESYFYSIQDKIQQYIEQLDDSMLSVNPENCDMSRFRLILGQIRHWHNYTIEVHALKSSSKQIGAIALSEKAAALEKAGNENNGEIIHQNTEEMLDEYLTYEKILAPYFTEEKNNDPCKDITADKLQELFNVIREAAEELDMDKIEETIHIMEQYKFDSKQKEYLEQLKNASMEYDVDRCEEIIEEWEKQ